VSTAGIIRGFTLGRTRIVLIAGTGPAHSIDFFEAVGTGGLIYLAIAKWERARAEIDLQPATSQAQNAPAETNTPG
jgi:hypothetical protein